MGVNFQCGLLLGREITQEEYDQYVGAREYHPLKKNHMYIGPVNAYSSKEDVQYVAGLVLWLSPDFRWGITDDDEAFIVNDDLLEDALKYTQLYFNDNGPIKIIAATFYS